MILPISRNQPLHADCEHEEADTRILLRLQDALTNDSSTCLVLTVDTDVVEIIGKFHTLLTKHPAADIWIAFGTGKNFTYMHIKSAWKAWESYPEVMQAFIYMAAHPHTPLTVESQYFRHLENTLL